MFTLPQYLSLLKWFAFPFSNGPCLVKHLTKDGDALYSQQKEDWELTVAQIMKSLLQNSDLN